MRVVKGLNESKGEEMVRETAESKKSSNDDTDSSSGSEDDSSSEMDNKRNECLRQMAELERQFIHMQEEQYKRENLLACEEATNPVSVKGEGKENVDNMMQICPEKSAASSESNEKMANAVNKQGETKEKRPRLKVPRKEESIHNHMAKNEKKARQRRIRQRNQFLKK